MTIETKATYQIIKADDGMVLTEWHNGDDILNYAYSTKQYSPLTYDITKLREITQEESDRLVKEQEEKLTTPTTKVVGFLGQARSNLPL